ncbi:Armadillo-like helical [Penicillium argentinense]|uniref:Armadillo-like helical n=1 Tax=Penicillium argentinense TaxID=1131581 RepID=A0A9W9F7R5_9EURO|nr:Armadillo-like helical [Penicillium argentinense]KAJ5095181.1 Armadillo-like helical [Penicillium argentinense]
MMSSLNGPSKHGPSKHGCVNKEGRFAANDVDARMISFRRESSGHQHSAGHHRSSEITQGSKHTAPRVSNSEDIEISSNKKQKFEHLKAESLTGKHSRIEELLADLNPRGLPVVCAETDRPSASSKEAPMNEPLPSPGSTEATDAYSSDPTARMEYVSQLRQELLAAKSTIALQEQELAQTRVLNQTLDQALGPPSEADFSGREITEQTISHLQNAFNASNPAFGQYKDAWGAQDDSHSDISDALSAGGYNRARGRWPESSQQAFGMSSNERPFAKPYEESHQESNPMGQYSTRLWSSPNAYPIFAPAGGFQSQRVLSTGSSSTYGSYSRPPSDQPQYPHALVQVQNPLPRHSSIQANHAGAMFPPPANSWSSLATESPVDSTPTPKSPTSSTTRSTGAFQSMGNYPFTYHARQVGTALSPTATEFTAGTAERNPWAISVANGNSIQTYVPSLGPPNYRRLLEKNEPCDWKHFVDMIVCGNDQQASIFLQQKLKVGTGDQKFEIIEAIIIQAYPLMVNRFGNFLIQRCFEHGTPEQVVAIANAISGRTLTLSMDPFGCHVIQKALDCVPEDHKTAMVQELLCRIPETVVHRYACHVWQKLFELRWSGEPPQIMAKVNEALCGLWHEVALGETGSLVVQNIFENCVEAEKRPAIEEVLEKIDILAHGQFGNWCIQHICEHGAPPDKSRATEHVLHHAVDYSMDQFASKIVEKCLKIGGSEFLERYLSRVCTGRTDRPRMPLIDIAGDQYGNYLIQWVLMNAAPHQRELVAGHIRKHMVSLRGSKFGSRVAMLCCNPSHATRPGPGTGMPVGRFNQFNEERFPSSGQNGGRFGRGNQWNPRYAPFRPN